MAYVRQNVNHIPHILYCNAALRFLEPQKHHHSAKVTAPAVHGSTCSPTTYSPSSLGSCSAVACSAGHAVPCRAGHPLRAWAAHGSILWPTTCHP